MNEFLEKAVALRPKLNHYIIKPVSCVTLIEDTSAFQHWRTEPDQRDWKHTVLNSSDELVLDFGEHMTGHLNLSLSLAGTRQDAPVKIRLQYGEMPCDIAHGSEEYNGWISAAWLQEETFFIDQLPYLQTQSRRYAFRYLKIQIIAASIRFGVRLDDVSCDATTSADITQLAVPSCDEIMRSIFQIATSTLRDCMQEVFEDGPKRDRRLWMGDLRLQALVNYATYRNNSLVKRCLYLFAGACDERGLVPAAVYDTTPPQDDEAIMLDYSLLFVSALNDYLTETQDALTAKELFPVAIAQLSYVHASLSDNGTVSIPDGITAFIDWNDKLDKTVAIHGVYCYALQSGCSLAAVLGEGKLRDEITQWLEQAKASAMEHYWDENQQCFVSGNNKQHSWASQIWMVLGSVVIGSAASELLHRTLNDPPQIRMITPYMRHYWIEALLTAGETELARKQILAYWGEMMALGADTFWEIFDPEDPSASPYGGAMIHSYCHAWSCTPAWWIGKGI